MTRKGWLALFGLSSALILAFLASAGRGAVAHYISESSIGGLVPLPGLSMQQEPAIHLALSTTPSAVSPGDTFSLILEIKNSFASTVSPILSVESPASISADTSTLPTGASFDVQNSRLSWQPLLQGSESKTSAAIRFKANVADIHNPQQTISVRFWDGFQEQIVSTDIWIGVLPMASITLDPPQVAVGQPVQLKGLISGPGPINQEWYLGDGRIVNAVDPTVIYPVTGRYDITLKASNPLGSSPVVASLNVLPQPIAHFKPSDLTVSAGQEIAFQNESGGEPPLLASWDFGDGFGSQEESPLHHFSEPGSYLVHLKVENGYGQSESYAQITVDSPPIADAIIPASGVAGQVVEASAFTDDSVTEIVWDMGDGRTHTGANIKHVYWSAGSYQMTMTAYNDYGSKSITQPIVVEAGMLFLYLPLSISSSSSATDPPLPESDGNLSFQATLETVSGSTIQELEQLQFPADAGPADMLLAYINDARVRNNLRPLRYVHELSVAAQRHVDDMANSGITGHVGSDDSFPELRIQQSGYPGGYGGEATAWGMQDPIDPVKFWLESPGHRAILLHPGVSDVGVGYALNYDSPNIWYWTAEFASLSLPAIQIQPTPTSEVNPPRGGEEPGTQTEQQIFPDIQLLGPPQSSQISLISGNRLIFTWSYGQALSTGQNFVVVLTNSDDESILGAVNSPVSGNQYQLSLSVDDFGLAAGEYLWQVRLIDESGINLSSSNPWTIQVNEADNGTQSPSPTIVPSTATPVSTETPQPVVQPTPLPLATPLPTREP